MAKIMISSTSEDLVAHRSRVLATLRRLEQDGVGMEAFGAEPNSPVDVCKQKVDQSDLVILIVAHRYGWVPLPSDGGDGIRSITRIEFDQARKPSGNQAPKPVLAFLVDEKAEWTGPREQDRLLAASSPEEALNVYKDVRELKRFKSEIGSLVRDTFTTPADLSDRVSSAVSKWLLQRQAAAQRDAEGKEALARLLERVADLEAGGRFSEGMLKLKEALTLDEQLHNRAVIADRWFKIANVHLTRADERLRDAATAVLEFGGVEHVEAMAALGSYKSQLARVQWDSGQTAEAWKLGLEAREHLVLATREDKSNPDYFGSLGGVLKRLRVWAVRMAPERVVELEDEMLAAYEHGWHIVPDAYPLLNFIEERARVKHQRDPTAGRAPLIGENDGPLRIALRQALKTREGQLPIQKEKPWAAFDLARGRHYLRPNVPQFLEDLEAGIADARAVVTQAEDRYMILTTRDSLSSLLHANVDIEGLEEGIALLEHSVAEDDWFVLPPKPPVGFLEAELAKLRMDLVGRLDRQAQQSSKYEREVTQFIQATEVRWSRVDEERFQAYLKQWKKDLEPKELKIARGLWKIFGGTATELLTGGVPVDWDAAAEFVGEMTKK